MSRYKEIEYDESSLKKLTGLRKPEFNNLHSLFDNSWQNYFSNYTLDGKPRLRQASIRCNSIFSETEDALLFGLTYIKNKTLQEKLAQQIGIDQPKASRYLKLIGRMIYQIVSKNSKGLPPKKRTWLLQELSSAYSLIE